MRHKLRRQIRRRSAVRQRMEAAATAPATTEFSLNASYKSDIQTNQNKRRHQQTPKRGQLKRKMSATAKKSGPTNKRKRVTKTAKDLSTVTAAAGEESKSLILKLLGDKTVENELLTDYEAEANLLQDLDLVILAASPEDYKRYTQLLRREYKHMNDEGYKVMRLKTTDDTSLISVSSPSRKDRPFKKFRDYRNRENIIKTHALTQAKSISQASSTGQLVTKKLLRTIKRRQLQRATPTAVKRRLNLNSTVKLLANNTLEEGEIRSDNEESELSQLFDKSSSDDDCICIEPIIEEIIVDDDIPSTSHHSSGYISAVQRRQRKTFLKKWVTSTPFARKPASNVGLSPAENGSAVAGNPSPFFEDVTGAPWFETINSADTFADYTKQTNIARKETWQKSTRPSVLQNHEASNEVIVLDDTLADKTVKATNKQNSTAVDDSVIFVGEVNAKPAAMDFIPLESAVVSNPVALVRNQFTPKKAKNTNNLFTASEKKQLEAYNTNTYNPSVDATAKSTKRMVVIDGSNVAFQHSLNKEFSVKGLKICIEYFDKMGHEVKAIVPQFRVYKCSDPVEMNKLYEAGKVVVTPCKNLPGKSSVSYDDRFVLQLASELDAVIVSNDNYRDLLHENPAFKKIIENRVLGFTWCNDIFMVARDPYGKWGPTLQTILNRC